MAGRYICLEGGDGAGKSTLAGKIVEAIPKSAGIHFPSGGLVGSFIRKGLMGEVEIDPKAYLYLFSADGIQEDKWIEGVLLEGHDIVCDRHPTLSGRVYQLMHHREQEIEAVYNAAANDGLRMPDQLFVMDIDPELALERMSSRKKYKDVVFESDKLDELSAMRKCYLVMARRFGGHILDASKSTEELLAEVLEVLS
jgi:dTMP kinase